MAAGSQGEQKRFASLPIERTSFVGRQRELAQLQKLLATDRLVTVTGPAGCGKTRLALRVAAEVSDHYGDGVHWLPLAALDEADLLPKMVARGLGIPESVGGESIDNLVHALIGWDVLLVLDNCEHLLPACTALVERLIGTTDVQILTTSRAALNVSGEKLYPLDPLTVPPQKTPIDVIPNYEAVELFTQRARAILPSFDLTAKNAAKVAAICRRLDGVPLAIELASARIRVLSVEQIADRLADHFDLLSEPLLPSHSHHNTLRAAIDWSYNLLSASERVLLRRLAVFAGGWRLAAAEAVCCGDQLPESQVLARLSALVNKSLVEAHTLNRPEARYNLLEIVRQYAREKLVAAGEWTALRDKHLDFLLRMVEETEPKLRGSYQQMWLDWLEGDFDNLRASLAWALESGRIEEGLRIIIALYQLLTIRDFTNEGLSWLERLLAKADDRLHLAVRAQAVTYAMTLAGFRNNLTAIKKYGQESAGLVAVADDDPAALHWALTGQYYAARVAGDHQKEYALVRRLIKLQRQHANPAEYAVALSIYSFSAMSVGEYQHARELLDESLPQLRNLDMPYRVAMALNFSGDLARLEGDFERAQTAYEESSLILRELEAVRDLASVLHNLGLTCVRLGEIERAQMLITESLALHEAQHNDPGKTECLIGFAALAIVGGLSAQGAQLLASVVSIGGERAATAWAATQQAYQTYTAQARERLGDAEFEHEQQVGRALSLQSAVDLARVTARQALVAQTVSAKPDALTPRERQVAALIAQAKTNDEIAGQLVISKRTVEKHIANIRSKLSFTQRTEIVRWAIDNELLPQDDQ